MSEYICILLPIVKFLSKIKCRYSSLSAVVSPRKSGRTELVKSLEDKRYILLDLDSSVKMEMTNEETQKLNQLERDNESTSYNSFYYPLCKRYLQKLKKNFKKKNIIVFSSDPELVKYLEISNVLYLSPSNKLFSTILDKYQNDNGLKKLLQQSRDNVVSHAGKKLCAYNSYEQMMSLVADKFSLKPKL